MVRTIRSILLSLTVLAAVLLPAVPALAATDPFGGTCNMTRSKGSAVCESTPGDGITTTSGVIHRVTMFIAILGGAVAVIMLVIGGIRYISSNGSAEEIGRAKRTIIYSVVGLVVIVLGEVIISFVLMGI